MKLFIFDMGGVVARNVAITTYMSGSLGISEDDFFRFAASDPKVSHTSPYHLGDIAAYMKGTINGRQFWDNFSRRSGIPINEDLWYTHFKPDMDNGTVSVIQDLKKAGYRVVCGTNTLESHFRYHIEQGQYAMFDKVYASDAMHVIKPEPGFWNYIINAEGVKAGDAFFTDDLEENVIAAKKLGLNIHHFKNAEGLRTALREYL